MCNNLAFHIRDGGVMLGRSHSFCLHDVWPQAHLMGNPLSRGLIFKWLLRGGALADSLIVGSRAGACVCVCVCVCTAAPWMVCCMTEQLAVVMERRRLRWKEVRAAIVYCPPWLVLATRRNAKQASPRFNCHSLGQSWSWSQLSHCLQALIVTSVIIFILIGDL